MSRTERASPIPKFLGVSGDSDAFDLLGIGPDQATPGQVEASLQRQLDRVSAHAEGDTPEGDEVRLALHAAAAQVLDAAARRQLIELRGQKSVEGVSPAPVMEPVVAPVRGEDAPVVGARYTPPADTNAPVRQLILIGGVGGGLAVVAIVLGLIFLTPGAAKTPSALSGGTSTNSGATTTGPGSKVSAAAPATDASAKPSGDGQAQAADSQPGNTPVKSGRSEFVDGALVVRQLRAASAKARTDGAEGLAEFRSAIRPLADWWAKFDVGQRRAADDAVLEFLYVVAEKPDFAAEVVKELARRAALPPIEAGPLTGDAVWPAAWATGVLVRLGEERGLPRSVASLIATALNDTLGAGRAQGTSSFEAGAEAALRRMPTRLVAPLNPANKVGGAEAMEPRSAEGVRRWADAVVVVTDDSIEQERILADGLEQILVEGPSAEEDRAAFEAIETLVTRIKWRAGGPARERLLEWFNDVRVSAGGMRVVTSVLAGKSGAEGVDASMQLSVTASPDDRAQLRARYATAWGLAKPEAKGQAMVDWRSKADALNQPITDAGKDDDLARVARLVVAVRTNLAARRLWLGDSAGCTRILGDLDRLPSIIRDIGTTPPSQGAPPTAPMPAPITARPRGGSPIGIAPPAPGPNPPAPYSQGDGPWAEVYLRAERNIPVRLHRLAEAETLSLPLSRGDAAVLVEAALFASPASVRQAAQRVVMRFGDDPSIVEACLDELPLAPRVQSVSDTLAKVAKTTLPKIGDPEWELAARRALVDRALGLLAGQGPQAGIDQGCALIAEAYVAMAGTDSGPADETAADRCVRGAGQLFRLWRLEADRLPPPEKPPLSLEQIERRRRSREQIASGPMQVFAGEEASVAELFAYVVCAERPVQAAKATTIIDDMARERRGADHVFEQMRVTEKAIARLWNLRLGEVAP